MRKEGGSMMMMPPPQIRAELMSYGVVVMAIAGKVTLGGAQPYSW